MAQIAAAAAKAMAMRVTEDGICAFNTQRAAQFGAGMASGCRCCEVQGLTSRICRENDVWILVLQDSGCD